MRIADRTSMPIRDRIERNTQLEKLNELDLDAEADLCEKLHDDAEHLFRTLSSRLDELQDGN
ncbi:Rop family plasmid primer RNA-binding protein [Escherichia coli]